MLSENIQVLAGFFFFFYIVEAVEVLQIITWFIKNVHENPKHYVRMPLQVDVVRPRNVYEHKPNSLGLPFNE